MTQELSPAEIALRDAARDYHCNPSKGKLSLSGVRVLIFLPWTFINRDFIMKVCSFRLWLRGR